MSLSFVSKTIQTSTEDGGYEETPVQGADIEGGGESSSLSVEHRPLFEQLRHNREKYDAEQEESQRAIMRGAMGVLEEEDVAHLEALRRRRDETASEIQQQTHLDVAAFRAARAGITLTDPTPYKSGGFDEMSDLIMRQQDSSSLVTDKSSMLLNPSSRQPVSKASLPVIIKRKKRMEVRTTSDEKTMVKNNDDSGAEDNNKKQKPNDSAVGHNSRLRNTQPSVTDSQINNDSVSTDKPTNNTLLSSNAASNEGLKGECIGSLLAGYDSSSEDST